MCQTTYTKESLTNALINIRSRGWIKSIRNVNNDGAIGNTLEDLLGISENNLPIPNASEWELKTQRRNTTSLVTLFHLEPSPRALHIVNFLLSNYGWTHQEAGKKYPNTERSFRQTLSYNTPTSRGFFVDIDNDNKKILIRFDSNYISDEHIDWKQELINRNSIIYKNEYIPYWGFADLYHKAGTKLVNCFFIIVDTKKELCDYYYKYSDIMQLSNFTLDKLLCNIVQRNIFIDFDARTGHNHGTKFRIRPSAIHLLYDTVKTF